MMPTLAKEFSLVFFGRFGTFERNDVAQVFSHPLTAKFFINLDMFFRLNITKGRFMKHKHQDVVPV